MWAEPDALRVAYLHGPWRSIPHPRKGHCNALEVIRRCCTISRIQLALIHACLQACGPTTVLAGMDKHYVRYDLHAESTTVAQRFKR